MCFVHIYLCFIESQNHKKVCVGRDLKYNLVPHSLPCAGTSSTSPGFSKPLLHTRKLLKGLHEDSFSLGWATPDLSTCLHRSSAKLCSCLWPSSGLVPASLCPFYTESLSLGRSIPEYPSIPEGRVQGENHLPAPAGHISSDVAQDVKPLAFWAASAHCLLMLSFLFTTTPKSFTSRLLLVKSLPTPYLCLGLPWSTYRTHKYFVYEHKEVWAKYFICVSYMYMWLTFLLSCPIKCILTVYCAHLVSAQDVEQSKTLKRYISCFI